MSAAIALSYVLPLRWTEDQGLEELAAYLRALAEQVEEVIVVDGSPSPRFERHAARLGADCLHIRPDADLAFAYPKVDGITTGMRRARAPKVVLADDDVRYGEGELRRVSGLLDRADLVRPQNY